MRQQNHFIVVEDIQAVSWEASPDLSLQYNDLWKISIPKSLRKMDQLFALLSPDEKARVARYFQQKDKNRFTVGRGMLRQILGYYLNSAAREIRLLLGTNKKPQLPAPSTIAFNLSYSHDYVLVGVGPEPLGVDIEFINPQFDYEIMLDACFMKQEIAVIKTSDNGRKEFFRYWTRKEALLKATALGLGDYLTDFSCLNGVHPFPPTLDVKGEWRIASCLLEESYWISIATESPRHQRFIDANAFFD